MRVFNPCPIFDANQSEKTSILLDSFSYPLIWDRREFLFICISFSNITHDKGHVTNESNFYHGLNDKRRD